MSATYNIAAAADYDEVIDLGNYVFSHDHAPIDFPQALPKLYKREHFMNGIHYCAREDGRIKAVIGAYPLTLIAGGETLTGRGIGMVSVHPYARGRGYMKTLMNMALAGMKKDGAAFSCLSGRRQRYEYFGYARAGTAYRFDINTDNIKHTAKDVDAALRLEASGPHDAGTIAAIRTMHEQKPCRFARPRDDAAFFDTLSSWRSAVYAIRDANGTRGDADFLGYALYDGAQNTVHEMMLNDWHMAPHVFGLLLETLGKKDIAASAHALETEKIAALSGFAESFAIEPAYQFNIFDWPRFASAFTAARNDCGPVADGSFTLEITAAGPAAHTRLQFTAKNGAAAVTANTYDSPPDLVLMNGAEAADFLFSPFQARRGIIAKSPFLQSLLPLPLFFDRADAI